MKTAVIDAFARAFGIFVFAVVFLCIDHKAFPGNWLALAAAYFACVPLAGLYGLLVDPPSGQAARAGRGRVPGLLIIGVAVLAASVGYTVFKTKIGDIGGAVVPGGLGHWIAGAWTNGVRLPDHFQSRLVTGEACETRSGPAAGRLG